MSTDRAPLPVPPVGRLREAAPGLLADLLELPPADAADRRTAWWFLLTGRETALATTD